MTNYAAKEEISSFLEKAKQLIVSGKYDFVPRRKNLQALAMHGLTISQDTKRGEVISYAYAKEMQL